MKNSVRIRRKYASFQYRRWPERPPAWGNNDCNNLQDIFEVFRGEEMVLSFPVQTVANLAGLNVNVRAGDTIAPGEFFIRAFVEPRLYKCRPHGIVGAKTIGGDFIGDDSTTDTNKLRWLIHDQKNFSGAVTRVAWSAGCFVLPVVDLELFNLELTFNGIRDGDIIPCTLIEEA